MGIVILLLAGILITLLGGGQIVLIVGGVLVTVVIVGWLLLLPFRLLLAIEDAWVRHTGWTPDVSNSPEIRCIRAHNAEIEARLWRTRERLAADDPGGYFADLVAAHAAGLSEGEAQRLAAQRLDERLAQKQP